MAICTRNELKSLVMAASIVLAGCASGPRLDGPPVARSGSTLPAPPSVWEDKPVEPKAEPIRAGGPNKPYEVLGERYEPLTEDKPWREEGLASWYGTKFHGRSTASGELYSMYGMTAAHKTLPIPSYVRVRSKRNGQEVILRVNDRGPFVKGRVIDVSYAAAIRLGLVGAGVGEVEVERLTFEDIRTGAWRQPGAVLASAVEAPPPAPSAPPSAAPVPAPTATSTAAVAIPEALPQTTAPVPVALAPAPVAVPPVERPAEPLPVSRAGTAAGRGYWVQLAALGRREGVDRLQQQVARDLSGLLPLLGVFREQGLYKLKIGPFANRAEAQDAVHRARDALRLEPMLVQHR
jgi:rare lipoprotein A